MASRNGTFGSAVSDYVNSYILEPSYQRDMKACSKVITGKVNERSKDRIIYMLISKVITSKVNI